MFSKFFTYLLCICTLGMSVKCYIHSRRKFEGFIIGGDQVNINQFPYAAMVIVDGWFRCGGTIINSWAVVTAAHCFGEEPAKLQASQVAIAAGLTHNYQNKFLENKPGNVYNASHLKYHEEYDDWTLVNDIAMIFVKTPFKFSDDVQKAILVNNEEWRKEEDNMFVAIGWGFTERDGETASSELMMTHLSYRSNEKCVVGQHSTTNDKTNDRFCLFGDGVRDTCTGDSGTGVFWNNYFVGIVSYGSEPCAGNSSSVYANVYHFRNWIHEAIIKFRQLYCKNLLQ